MLSHLLPTAVLCCAAQRKLTKTGLAQRMVTHLEDWFSLAGLLANVSAVC